MILKMKNKKGATIRDGMLILIGFIMFFGIFVSFIVSNANMASVEINETFTEDYQSLVVQQNSIDDMTTSMRSAAQAVDEAKFGDFAYFGFKGMLAVMTIPLQFVNIATNSVGIVSKSIPVSDILKGGILLCLIIIVLFAVIKFITSRGQEP